MSTPYTAGPTPGQAPGQAQSPSWGPGPTTPQGGAAPAGPRRPSPFAGVPFADYLTDVVAAVLLLVSLALPWNLYDDASDRIDVVLVTVVCVLSLCVHYLVRAGVFPGGWSLRTAHLIRAGVNALYAVLVLVYLVIDIVAVAAPSSGVNPGLGAAAGIGLAGAVLAASPRRAELDAPAGARPLPGLWTRSALGLAALVAVSQLAALVLLLTNDYLGMIGGWLIALSIVTILAVGALGAWSLVGVGLGRPAFRPVLVTVGVVAAFALLVMSSQSRWTVAYSQGVVPVLLPAGAALALNPALVRAFRSAEPVDARARGVRTAQHAWEHAILIAGLSVVVCVLTLASGYTTTARTVVVLLLSAFIVVAALVARATTRGDALAGRIAAIGATCAIAVVGLVILIINAASWDRSVSWLDLLLAFGLPVLAIGSLLVPSVGHAVSGVFSSVRPAAPAQPFGAPDPAAAGTPTWAAPAAASPVTEPVQTAQPVQPVQPAQAPATPPPPAPPAPAPSHGFTAQQAADPSTDLAVLARIAAEAPELRPTLASNPSTYPALLEWLAQVGDPAVDAALRARRG